MYPCRLEEAEIDDLASADVADEVERDEMVEKVRSGDGHEEIAGVAGMEGEGDEALTGARTDSESIVSSIFPQY
jgi:hypothetical protein